jgi:hypothetical protein
MAAEVGTNGKTQRDFLSYMTTSVAEGEVLAKSIAPAARGSRLSTANGITDACSVRISRSTIWAECVTLSINFGPMLSCKLCACTLP